MKEKLRALGERLINSITIQNLFVPLVQGSLFHYHFHTHLTKISLISIVTMVVEVKVDAKEELR